MFSEFDKVFFLTDICAWMPSVTVHGVLTLVQHHPERICWQGKQPTGFAAGGKPGKNPSGRNTETLTILTFGLADSVKMPHLSQ